jgi:hypothetical protein
MLCRLPGGWMLPKAPNQMEAEHIEWMLFEQLECVKLAWMVYGRRTEGQQAEGGPPGCGPGGSTSVVATHTRGVARKPRVVLLDVVAGVAVPRPASFAAATSRLDRGVLGGSRNE